MQLKKDFRSRLALATGALLGTASNVHSADGNWVVDAAALGYTESDQRITAIEPAVKLKREFDDDKALSIGVVFDSLSGASPNGAAVANISQTFTSASGRNNNDDDDHDDHDGSYSTKAGDQPLDSRFKDSRMVFSLGWEQPISTDLKMNVGGVYSIEGDFQSMSVNGALAKDVFNRNTTLSVGLNYEFDLISPHTNLPDPLTSYALNSPNGNTDSKQVVDGIFGITQVINRRWISQLNLSLSASSGYQNDPYKIITVADNGNLIIDPESPDDFLYLNENRPSDRLKKSIYWQNKFALFSNDAINIAYRYMTDDWGINSHTAEFSYHFQPSKHFYFEPSYRYYNQTAADFYAPFLAAGEDVTVTATDSTAQVKYASSDPRLGAFSADTIGFTLGFPLNRVDEEITFSAAYYQQHDQNTVKKVGAGSNLDGMDQFAELTSSWVQIGYTFRW